MLVAGVRILLAYLVFYAALGAANPFLAVCAVVSVVGAAIIVAAIVRPAPAGAIRLVR